MSPRYYIFKLLTHASLHFIFPFIAPRKVKLLCVNFIIFLTLLPKSSFFSPCLSHEGKELFGLTFRCTKPYHESIISMCFRPEFINYCINVLNYCKTNVDIFVDSVWVLYLKFFIFIYLAKFPIHIFRWKADDFQLLLIRSLRRFLLKAISTDHLLYIMPIPHS